MGFKAHQYLLPRTLFNGKIYWQFLLAEKRNRCCFDVLSERSSLISAQDKRLQNTISIIYHIVLSPILNSNEPFRCYDQSGFLMNLFFLYWMQWTDLHHTSLPAMPMFRYFHEQEGFSH